MSYEISGGFVPTYMPEVSVDSSHAKDKVIGFYKGFQSQLGDLMKTLLDDTKPLQLDGYNIPADQKSGTAGTMLIEQWRSEQDFIFSQLLDAYKFEQTLANKLNSFFGS